MILTIAIFTLVNIILSFTDAHKIIKGTTINHVLNAAIYTAIVIVPFFVFHNWLLIAALLFNRLLFFNIFLSLFRGKKWDYIPLQPVSYTDRMAKLVFNDNGQLMYGVYAVIFVVLIIFSYMVQ